MSRPVPYLLGASSQPDKITPGEYPFTIPVLQNGLDLKFRKPVTFFVGDNGSGKSTILEALAAKAEFDLGGGTRDHRYSGLGEETPLSRAIRLSWRKKIPRGFFLRAETFFNFASYMEESAPEESSDKFLHTRSHGEAFLSLFKSRFREGIYILDEPEAALSPEAQLAFLLLIRELDLSQEAQLIIATHSPILICYPDADVLSLDGGEIRRVHYSETKQFQFTKSFLDSPERYLHHLFTE